MRRLILTCDDRGGSSPRRDTASRERGLQFGRTGGSHGPWLDQISLDSRVSYIERIVQGAAGAGGGAGTRPHPNEGHAEEQK